jgi:hypothetical protein
MEKEQERAATDTADTALKPLTRLLRNDGSIHRFALIFCFKYLGSIQ